MKQILSLLFLLLCSTANAQTESTRAWPLQFHCGTQDLPSGNFLSYGLLVYQELRGSAQAEIKIATFDTVLSREEYHPFCAAISSAMADDTFIVITIAENAKTRRLISLSK